MLQLVAGLEYCFSLSHSKLCFLHEATFLGGEEKKAGVGVGMGGGGAAEKRKREKCKEKRKKRIRKRN